MRACRARKPLPCALRSSATPALAGDASVLQHHPQGLGLCLCLSLQWKQLSLVYFVVPSACACSSEVTVTSYSHPPSVSPRGIVTLGQSHRPTFSLACEPGLGLCGFIHAPARWIRRKSGRVMWCAGLLNQLLKVREEQNGAICLSRQEQRSHPSQVPHLPFCSHPSQDKDRPRSDGERSAS